MTVVTRQDMSDDDGTFTFGTAVNKAFVDQIYGQVDDQVHSAANPTIKPNAITDEVVTARNGQASLNAYLATIGSAGSILAGADLGSNWEIGASRDLRFADPDVAHGMTALVDTDHYGKIGIENSLSGTLVVHGFSDTDSPGIYIRGTNGGAAPTNSAVFISGSKKNGTTNQAMAAGEPIIVFQNLATILGVFYSSGLNVYTGLAVGFSGAPGDDEIQLGDADFKLDFVSSDTSTRLQFASGDYLRFDRSINELFFVVGSATVTRFDSSGRIATPGLSFAGAADEPQNTVMTFLERADPGVAGTNCARLYAKDNGAGKTQLVVIFQSGAVQVLATEP